MQTGKIFQLVHLLISMTVFLRNMEKIKAKNLTLAKVEYLLHLAHRDLRVAKDQKVQRKKRLKNENLKDCKIYTIIF